MALIEIEMLEQRFNQLVHLLVSAGPIPIGILSGLGVSRLIAEFTWNRVEVGHAPPGFVPPVGVLTARCEVTLRHVSTDELDVDPNAVGTTTRATSWVNISANTSSLMIDLLAVEVPAAPTQFFTPQIRIARHQIDQLEELEELGIDGIAAALLLFRDGIVTVRFATRATDPIQSVPLNLLAGVGDEWAIRLSGELFTDALLAALQKTLAKPPGGTTVEDAPTAFWGVKGGSFAAIGSVGLEKKDACPGLFGDVDISVTVDVALTPSANFAVVPPQLDLTLQLSSNASDWDALRCWLGSFGLGSALLGFIAGPIVGPVFAGLALLISSISTLIIVGEKVRLDAGKEVSGTDVEDFTPTSSTSTTATFIRHVDLPSLNDSVESATTGPLGMLISGRILLLPAIHEVTFTPNGGALVGTLRNSFDCGRRTWQQETEVQDILIEDRADVLGRDLGRVPVTVFKSSAATPPDLWSVEYPVPSPQQLVAIRGSKKVKPGDTGRVYLHTSAGIRRFDIPAVPPLAAPTQQETIAAVAQCARKERVFTPREELEWLIDPPPFDFGYPALRQWLFTFAELPAATRIVIHRVSDGVRSQAMEFTAEHAGEASLEFITDPATNLFMEHNQDVIAAGRLLQRWVIPTEMIDIREPGLQLMRSGSMIAVAQRGGVFAHDLETGSNMRQPGELRLTKLATGGLEVMQQTRRHLSRGLARKGPGQIAREIAPGALPFSLTLPGGKVAALYENKLFIGIPWQPSSIIMAPRQ
ncbi:hypothetical protein D3880_00630 [Pseudomonas cavernae]|uniref:Uncharacterized protein n=1 Tax=Pseudomonas cavernae TaxID=2320867 RepID=A0A385YVT9_9PSED|nr:hypothetical protein [Pseudomonas cavernae]AYC30979.1 hypothetical protein D3880_00630 [Pseudomonas cavernae]